MPLDYDHRALAEEMKKEGLPREFIETVLTGAGGRPARRFSRKKGKF